MEHLLTVIFAVCGAILLLFILKKGKLRFFLLSAFSGIAALFAADLICSYFNFSIPVNPFTVLLGAVGGLPGVILLNILSVLFR